MGRDTACTAGLFNPSPYITGRCFNQLNSQCGAKFTHLGSKEKSYTKFICFFGCVSCRLFFWGLGQAELHLVNLASQLLKRLVLFVVGHEMDSAVSAQTMFHKSSCKHIHTRSNVQTCFPDALYRSETCQCKS